MVFHCCPQVHRRPAVRADGSGHWFFELFGRVTPAKNEAPNAVLSLATNRPLCQTADQGERGCVAGLHARLSAVGSDPLSGRMPTNVCGHRVRVRLKTQRGQSIAVLGGLAAKKVSISIVRQGEPVDSAPRCLKRRRVACADYAARFRLAGRLTARKSSIRNRGRPTNRAAKRTVFPILCPSQ
jgi:hypothetical protein